MLVYFHYPRSGIHHFLQCLVPLDLIIHIWLVSWAMNLNCISSSALSIVITATHLHQVIYDLSSLWVEKCVIGIRFFVIVSFISYTAAFPNLSNF